VRIFHNINLQQPEHMSKDLHLKNTYTCVEVDTWMTHQTFHNFSMTKTCSTSQWCLEMSVDDNNGVTLTSYSILVIITTTTYILHHVNRIQFNNNLQTETIQY